MRKNVNIYWVVALAILVLPGMAAATAIDACGSLVQGVECVFFLPDAGEGQMFLGDFGEYVVGDYVHIVGTLDYNCVNICLEGDGCVEVNIIESCESQNINSCGTLVQGTECVLFQADNDGGLWFGDFGDYAVGDNVLIVGTLDPDCVNICLEGDGCVNVETITDCQVATEQKNWSGVKALYR